MEVIDLLPGDERLGQVFPVLAQLQPHLNKQTFDMVYREGHPLGLRLTAVFEDGQCVAVGTWRVVVDFYSIRKMHIDDFVTCDGVRSKGYGKVLLDALHDRATTTDCYVIDLDSGVPRFDAHRFYMRERFRITSHHFEKVLRDTRPKTD